MNRFMEMSHVELSEALENTINSIEASGGTGDWYDAVFEVRRRLSSLPAAQTFYVIKRSDAPHYFYFRDYGYGFDWTDDIREAILYDEKPIIEGMAPAALKTLTASPTARTVKVMVSEVEE